MMKMPQSYPLVCLGTSATTALSASFPSSPRLLHATCGFLSIHSRHRYPRRNDAGRAFGGGSSAESMQTIRGMSAFVICELPPAPSDMNARPGWHTIATHQCTFSSLIGNTTKLFSRRPPGNERVQRATLSQPSSPVDTPPDVSFVKKKVFSTWRCPCSQSGAATSTTKRRKKSSTESFKQFSSANNSTSRSVNSMLSSRSGATTPLLGVMLGHRAPWNTTCGNHFRKVASMVCSSPSSGINAHLYK
mmetsp:Transcript_59944/g.118897  ORF Transcript_59944/g.118897 Transcript_59944/m.118897 type:complete len:247 (+) Transcript_59944:574-1314(+)